MLVLARDIGTKRHSKNVIISATRSLQRHKNVPKTEDND